MQKNVLLYSVYCRSFFFFLPIRFDHCFSFLFKNTHLPFTSIIIFHIIKKYFIFFLSRSPVKPLFVHIFLICSHCKKEYLYSNKNEQKKVTNGRWKRKGAYTRCPEKKAMHEAIFMDFDLIRWKNAGAVKVQRYAKAPENYYFFFFFLPSLETH